jgi:hypothetical protein
MVSFAEVVVLGHCVEISLIPIPGLVLSVYYSKTPPQNQQKEKGGSQLIVMTL